MTGTSFLRSIFAVPPVARISIPKSVNRRAKSMRLVLSETLINARLILGICCSSLKIEDVNYQCRMIVIEGLVIQVVFFEFFTQGAAVKPQYFGRPALVATRILHDRGQQGLFHFADDHLIQIFYLVAIKVLEVKFYGGADTGTQGFFTAFRIRGGCGRDFS